MKPMIAQTYDTLTRYNLLTDEFETVPGVPMIFIGGFFSDDFRADMAMVIECPETGFSLDVDLPCFLLNRTDESDPMFLVRSAANRRVLRAFSEIHEYRAVVDQDWDNLFEMVDSETDSEGEPEDLFAESEPVFGMVLPIERMLIH
jgi:hypothetical protein